MGARGRPDRESTTFGPDLHSRAGMFEYGGPRAKSQPRLRSEQAAALDRDRAEVEPWREVTTSGIQSLKGMRRELEPPCPRDRRRHPGWIPHPRGAGQKVGCQAEGGRPRMPALGSSRGRSAAEELAPARVSPCDVRDRGLPRRPTVAPADESVPEGRPPHGEPDEAGDGGGRGEPRSTFASFSPRPRTMQPTLLRPSRRAAATTAAQSSVRSSPSIFQTSASMPASWNSWIASTMCRAGASGRRPPRRPRAARAGPSRPAPGART